MEAPIQAGGHDGDAGRKRPKRRLEALRVAVRCLVSHSTCIVDRHIAWLHLRILPTTSFTHAAFLRTQLPTRSCAPQPMRQGTGARTSLYTVLRIPSKNGAAAPPRRHRRRTHRWRKMGVFGV